MTGLALMLLATPTGQQPCGLGRNEIIKYIIQAATSQVETSNATSLQVHGSFLAKTQLRACYAPGFASGNYLKSRLTRLTPRLSRLTSRLDCRGMVARPLARPLPGLCVAVAALGLRDPAPAGGTHWWPNRSHPQRPQRLTASARTWRRLRLSQPAPFGGRDCFAKMAAIIAAGEQVRQGDVDPEPRP